MDSKPNTRSLLFLLGAVAFSGAALYLSQGLNPQWWAPWVAPLPLLWMAPRLPWTVAASVTLAAGMIGRLSLWGYHQRLQFPLWLQLTSVIVPAAGLCAGVVLFRILSRRGKLWPAALAFPSVMVAYEYLTSLGFGTFGNTAYTQLPNLLVLQLGALTGLWGISFVVLLFPSMIAALSLSPPNERLRPIVAFASVFVFTLTYGVWRLSFAPRAANEVVVGLAASDLPTNTLPENDEKAMRLLREYSEQVKLLTQRGAKIVVLPEMTALVRDSISPAVDDLFGQTARNVKAQIVLGVLHATSRGTFNEARLYSESAAPVVYRKHHLVPVLEGRTTPGSDISVAPASPDRIGGTIGLAICRDMDYTDPARRYGQARAGLVLAPAWDFDIDRLWHGHMAILRGVENGFTVVRAAKRGFLTVSDNRGRVLSETPTTPKEAFTTMVATAPIGHTTTLYASWGDWFAWLNLAFLAGLFLVVAKRSRERRSMAQSDRRTVGLYLVARTAACKSEHNAVLYNRDTCWRWIASLGIRKSWRENPAYAVCE